MLPATLAILSITFQGRERATAFAAWGATAGVAAACGPGRRRLPHDQLLVALVVPDQRDHRPARDHRRAVFMRDGDRATRTRQIDVVGAVLVAVGMFLARVRAQRRRHLRLV